MIRNRNRVLSIFISIMLIMSMVLSCVPVANAKSTDIQSSGGQEIGIYGDVDMNGEINMRDATRIQKYAAHYIQLTDAQLILADVDQNNRVDVKDFTALQKYILGYNQEGVFAGQVATEPDPTTTTTVEETTTSEETTSSSVEETSSSEEETTSSSVEETSSSEEETSSSVEETSSSVEETSSSIEETSSSVEETSSSEEETSSSVEETSSSVEETSSSVEETSSSVEETSSSVAPTTRRVWFRNDHNWSNVRIYAWYMVDENTSVKLTPWDEIPTITKDGQNNGKDMYYYDLPVEYTHVAFVSNRKVSRTVDITLDDVHNAYYPTEEKDSEGYEYVQAFVYGGETTSTSVEETSSSVEETSSVPTDMVTVTLDVKAIGSSGSRYAVYTFGGGNAKVWTDMTYVGDDVFTVQLDKNTFTKLIFVRMNGETTENNWDKDNAWNQTEDLTLDGTLYTVTGWGAELGAKLTGVWSTVEPTSTSVEETTTTIEETTTSEEETSSSEEETSSSVEETSSSEEETSSSVEETTSSVEETSSSVEETSSSVEETSSSVAPTTRRVWFRNDHNWSNVRIYAWYMVDDETSVKLTPWDEIPTMTKDGQDNGKNMYYYDLPVEYTNVIFTSNSKASQTVNITLDDVNNAYYPTDKKDGNGNEYVEAFVYGGETPSSSVEETSSSVEETSSSVEETSSSVEETSSSVEETSSVPADMVTVTLDVTAIGSSGSRYAVYTFGGGNAKVWTDMTNVSGDLFTVQLDKNTFTKLIFVRMDGETTENNWDNAWNQTEDLTLDGTLYTVTGWGAELGAKLTGVWGTVEPTTTTVEETTSSVEETSSSVEETSSSVEETSSSVEETSSSVAPTTKRVWFRNDHNWSNVRIYAWYMVDEETSVKLTPWDEIPTMTKDGQDNGKNMYYYDLPVEYTNVIFTSNSKASQTVNITLDDVNNAYYPTDKKDGNGNEYVEAFVYGGETPSTTVEETTTTAPVGDQVTLTLVDGTPENWLKNSDAVFVLVDNSTGTSYDMTGGAGTWTVTVPASVTNITINRNSPKNGEKWNSWTTTRGTGTTYTATSSGVGSWS